MALDRQNVQIPFAQGKDSKTDPKQVRLGKLLTLENGFLMTPQSIRKRYGYAVLTQNVVTNANYPSTTTIAAGTGLAAFNGELNPMDGSILYSYAPSGTDNSIVGLYNPTSLSVTAAVRNLNGQTDPDVGRHSSGIEVVTYEESASPSYIVRDSSTGTVLIPATGGIGGTRYKPIPFQTFVLVATYNTNAINFRRVKTVAPFNASGGTLNFQATGHATNINYDLFVANSRLYGVWTNTGGANGQLSVAYYDSSFALSSETTNAVDTARGVAITADSGGNIWIAYISNDGTVNVIIYNANLSSILGGPFATGLTAANRNVTITTTSTTAGYVFAEVTNADALKTIVEGAYISNAAALAGTVTIRGVGLASKLAVSGSNIYFNVVVPSTIQPTYLTAMFSTVQLATGTVNPTFVAKMAPSVAGGLTKYSKLPEFQSLGSNKYQFAFLQKDLLTAINGSVFTQNGVNTAQLTLAGVSPFNQTIANNLVLSGGLVQNYDGFSVSEQNFNIYPEIKSVTQSAGGALTAASTYQYAVVFEWMDNQGQIHQSAPSVASSITLTGGNQTATVTTYYAHLTTKSNVSIVLYRTLANGSLFYRQSSITSPTMNNLGVDTVAFVDTSTDASIIGNEQLYTNGGEVQNGSPPAAVAMTSYKNRLIIVDAANPTTWWYSKQAIPNVPLEFSPFFTQAIDSRGGGITACAAMDDKLIFFKSSAIFVVVGDGPAASGVNNDFTAGTLITADTGVPSGNSASVVVMGDGIMYQSGKGIELLDRSLNTHYIGADVEGDLGSNTIVSATLYAAYSQVRFVLSNGTALVYDYYNKDPNTGIGQWYVYTNHAAVAAVLFQNAYTYVNSAGLVFQESTSVFTDNGTFVSLKAVTSWLQLANIQGFERIRELEILGTWKSAHNLVVQVAYDFSSTYVQTDTIPSATTITPYQYRVHLARQKCEALQILIQDSNSGTPAESMSLSSLGLVLGVKRGLNKLPAAQSFG